MKNPYTQQDPDTLSVEEMQQIIKAIIAYNHTQPIEFNAAFLSYADNITYRVERPTPDTIRLIYGGIK